MPIGNTMHLYIRLYVHTSIFMSIHLSVCPYIHQYVCQYVCMAVHSSICPSGHPRGHLCVFHGSIPTADSVHHHVILPLRLMPRGIRGVVELVAVLQQIPQFQMPFPAYAIHAMGPAQVSSFLKFCLPPICLYMLVSVMVCAFFFQVPMWMPFSSMGTQPLEFVPLQPFGAYPWQAYVHPGDGLRSMLGMH